jgi:hypothetical protein
MGLWAIFKIQTIALTICPQFCKSEVQAGSIRFSTWTFQGLNQGIYWVRLISGFWGRMCFQGHSVCWWDSVPCGCLTEVPIFLLTIGVVLLSAPISYSWVLACGPLYSPMENSLASKPSFFFYQLDKTGSLTQIISLF